MKSLLQYITEHSWTSEDIWKKVDLIDDKINTLRQLQYELESEIRKFWTKEKQFADDKEKLAEVIKQKKEYLKTASPKLDDIHNQIDRLLSQRYKTLNG